MDAAAVRAESERLRAEAQRLRDDAVSRTNELLERVRARGAPHHDGELSLRLPRLRSSVGAARAAVEQWLDHCGMPASEAFDVVLATSEACANAVEHPRDSDRPAFRVAGRWHGTWVEISVQDFGRWHDGASDRTRGRGLAMIRSLMDEVEVVETAVGTGLWMSRRCGSADAPAIS